MQQIRPYKVLLFLVLVLSLLCLPIAFIPAEGVKWMGINWRFLPLERIWVAKKQSKKNIDKIVSAVDTTDINADVKHNGQSTGQSGLPEGGTLASETGNPLYISSSAAAKMNRFFAALQSAANGNKISIFHRI